MRLGNFEYLSSFSGIFRIATIVCGLPTVVLAWVAYFSSSWTKEFPEIQAILAADKSANAFNILNLFETNEVERFAGENETFSSSSSSSSEEDFDGQYDIISDAQEQYLDDILFQTLMYEKFFIGFATTVFIISTVYLLLRAVNKPHFDHESPYEIIFDFLFHVTSALGLLTGSALILLSAAKIQSFIDRVDDKLPAEVAEIIEAEKELQDKTDKVVAGVLGMANGILYAICVVTIRMVSPISCQGCRKPKKDIQEEHLPRFSVTSIDFRRDSVISYGNISMFSERSEII